ncbi:YceI family protein [Mycobacterium helveticum]|uniref:YceI family protein n=1 Tax=Mycobacterium helveticum TaxID=2592811 RepID=A0A557XYT5_9MYCO|nr:YceI family protein [Mycobacterium helveticum]TVS87520.1 YceI family protein [Mycobacterium helveticum]TVS91350.1 YceI family protein [Mycobacterium helveticum]
MTTLETLLNDPGTPGVWALAPERSSITFAIKNMWGLLSVKGRFTEFTGEGRVTDDGAVSGRVDIRAASLDTGIGRRDAHLRSADFFDVERFPEITVVVTGMHPNTGRAADVRADFTVKGVTAPLPLPVTVTELDDGAVRIAGQTRVERSRFGLGWNKFGMMAETTTAAADAVFVRVTG